MERVVAFTKRSKFNPESPRKKKVEEEDQLDAAY